MLRIYDCKTNYEINPIGLDEKCPRFFWKLGSDIKEVYQSTYQIVVCGPDKKNVWDSGIISSECSIQISYKGRKLEPFTQYTWQVVVVDNHGEKAVSEIQSFETGRLDKEFIGDWITADYQAEKKESPKPLTFRKSFKLKKEVAAARIYSTALGIYKLSICGKEVSEDYLTPGLTSYKNWIQYQTYDVTELLEKDSVLIATVAAGWATGKYGVGGKTQNYVNRNALLLEMHIEYVDGEKEIISTDTSFEVSTEGPLSVADIFDGEDYDATKEDAEINFGKAILYKGRKPKEIVGMYGTYVREIERLKPTVIHAPNGELIYDMGQNFAGVVHFVVNAKKGQKITISHGEILDGEGNFFNANLRAARAQVVYTAKEGLNEYKPRFTYMGFRYVRFEGIKEESILKVEGIVLSSDIETTGSFECSNKDINQLQSNIQWGQTSNFVDIPTDCPQRDERLGWTGDIAMFVGTAAFNKDIAKFMYKWTYDLIKDQGIGGGIPWFVPNTSLPVFTTGGWSDAATIVPWKMYQIYGDKELLRRQYQSMKRLVNAEKRWARLFSVGEKKYISTLPFNFGDWLAPGDTNKQCQKKAKYTSTAFFAYSAAIVAKAAKVLGYEEDFKEYSELSRRISEAYMKVHSDGNGRIKQGFQTAYVLPIHFEMTDKNLRQKMGIYLDEDVKNHGYKLTTGFLGTPFITFALVDTGHADTAYKLLLQDKIPSWLASVKAGATTIWEHWDAVDDSGKIDEAKLEMLSFNHYANGAVGDFMYRRVAGLEVIEPGYKRFRIAPIPGDGITYAKVEFTSMYGKIVSDWRQEKNRFILNVIIPGNTSAEVVMPDGSSRVVGSGQYVFETNI